jgi:hypothetical protein
MNVSRRGRDPSSGQSRLPRTCTHQKTKLSLAYGEWAELEAAVPLSLDCTAQEGAEPGEAALLVVSGGKN